MDETRKNQSLETIEKKGPLRKVLDVLGFVEKGDVLSRYQETEPMAKDTSLIQNAPGSFVPVCRVNTPVVSRLFRALSVNTAFCNP